MKSKVTPISKSKKYRWKDKIEDGVPPDDAPESGEEAYLQTLLLGSRVMSDIENGSVRKLIVFEKGQAGWFYNYVNITNPGEVIEALAPLWHSARTALRVVD